VDHLPAKQELSAIFFTVNYKQNNMKPLLYIGAALMIGAGIYGFVDFKNKNQRREFQSLYRQEQPKKFQAPAPVKPGPAIPGSLTEKKDTVVVNTAASGKPVIKKKNKKFTSKQFSRAALEEKDFDVVPLPEPEKKTGQ
jgi:hypothetical protein